MAEAFMVMGSRWCGIFSEYEGADDGFPFTLTWSDPSKKIEYTQFRTAIDAEQFMDFLDRNWELPEDDSDAQWEMILEWDEERKHGQ